MSDYVVTVNSTVDLPSSWLEDKGIPVFPLHYTISDKTFLDRTGYSSKEFFDLMRKGELPVTSQINPEEAREGLEAILKEGKDILHLAFSSALSGTYNSMRIAAEELQEEYPDRKIIVVDSKCACMGEGLLLYYVLKRQSEGYSLEEAAEWAENHKMHVCHNFTVDDLNHLHRGGRVSKAVAIMGTLVQIKPILNVDYDGSLQMVGQVRGRKKSIHKLVDTAAAQAACWKENDLVMITHGDCSEEAEYMADLVRKKIGIQEVLINNIGNVIGGHTGPGVLAVFCMGGDRNNRNNK